jgi:hypothetical protein
MIIGSPATQMISLSPLCSNKAILSTGRISCTGRSSSLCLQIHWTHSPGGHMVLLTASSIPTLCPLVEAAPSWELRSLEH